MKKSLNAWACPPEADFENVFRDLKAAGFDGVELNLDRADRSRHSLTLETTREEMKAVLDLSEKYALPVSGISCSLYGHDTLAGGLPENRENARRIMETQLLLAEYLKADGILIVPGGATEDRSIRQAWDNNQEALLSMKDLIASGPVNVGVENVWNNFFLSPMEMARFIDEMDIPHLGAYFDVGNVAIFSFPEYWIEILGKRIQKIHVKDFKKTGGNAGHFVNLLEGTIRWEKVKKALEQIGYDGFLTAELSMMPQTPQYLYRITSDALSEIISI